MAPIIELRLFIVFAMMSHLDADVRIVQNRINAGNNCTECGETLVLTCYIDNYFANSTMTWQNENSSLTLVSCTGSTCGLNPAVSSDYSKSEDTTTGTFNLTIPTVTRDNNGLSYLCENGHFKESSVVKVRDYRPILNETSGTTLKARSGCINESVEVIFSWRMFKAGTDAKSYDDAEYIGTNATEDTDFCTQDTECGLNGFVTLERTIEVKPGDENDYYLKAVISYDGFKMESVQTNRTYKIGAICDFSVYDGFAISTFIILFMTHFVSAIPRVRRHFEDLKCTYGKTICSVFPAFIFLLAYGIVASFCKDEEKAEKLCIFCKNIGIFGITCACLFGAFYFIGVVLIIWACRDKSKKRHYYVFFCTFLNLIILLCFVVYYRIKQELMQTKYRKKHRRIADGGEIPCEECHKKSSTYCLIHKLYLCLDCLDQHKEIKCVLLLEARDIDREDYRLCCNEIFSHNDLLLSGVCQDCDKFICSKCIKNHEHVNCTSHQQLRGPLNTRAKMCCDKEEISRQTVDFCIQCMTFICPECLKLHNKHLLISSLTNVKNGYAGLCCGLNNKINESGDFCVSCKKFICYFCLKEHNDHMVISALTGLISTRAGICCTKNKKINDFCIECQTFICDKCKNKHKTHIILSSLMGPPMNDVFCKGCPSVKRFPIECLALHEGVFLCASCYETGNLKKALENQSDSQESRVKSTEIQNKICQVHKVLGSEENSDGEVYCIICKMSMCIGCFKKHKRIHENWRTTQNGNLFYCNRCQTSPVECWDLTSMEFKCGKCYNFGTDISMSYPQEVISEMNCFDNTCKLHEDKLAIFLERKDSSWLATAAVYCLECQTTMCKSCFKKHRTVKDKNSIQPMSI